MLYPAKGSPARAYRERAFSRNKKELSLSKKKMRALGWKMPVVFIVSGEWDLRGAVRAELREAGIEALGMESVDDMAQAIASGISPSLVVLDGAQLSNPETRQSLQNLSSRLPVLVVNSRVSPAPPLTGATSISRPVQVKEIVARVLAMLSWPPR